MLPDCCYDYRYEAPQAQVITVCDICGEDICSGDSYYRIGNGEICSDCIDEFKEIAEEE